MQNHPIGTRNLTRAFMLLGLVVAIILLLIFASFGNQLIHNLIPTTPTSEDTSLAEQPTPTPTPTPSPTPTPTPTIIPTPTPTPTLAERIQGKAYYVMDMDTGAMLVEKNSTQQLAMGSITKIMTALVAMDNADPENEVVEVHQDAIDRVNLFGANTASSAQLVAGDILLLRDLLYGLLVPSGADAAIAIADDIGGSSDQFVQMMNNKAQQLGLVHTHFTSPDGLTDQDGQHYTTADDLAHLSTYAMNNYPLFAQIVQTAHYHVNGAYRHHAYDWRTWNSLLEDDPYPGTIGVKTGTTDLAGYCFVAAAAREGHDRVLAVVLGSPSLAQRNKDAITLLDVGFTLV